MKTDCLKWGTVTGMMEWIIYKVKVFGFGFFIYEVLKNFKNICKLRNENEIIKKYEKILENLKVSLNENGWDGKWYRRAYFSNGDPVGSNINDECKIDGISQSWAVISEAGEKNKCVQAMDSLENYLVINQEKKIPVFNTSIW